MKGMLLNVAWRSVRDEGDLHEKPKLLMMKYEFESSCAFYRQSLKGG